MDPVDSRFCFLVDWFDAHAQLTRRYQLFYYPVDSTIEMYDVKQRRTFLKRTKSDLRIEDLHVGAAVNVYARQLTIRGYGDEFTSRKLAKQMERALVIIKPTALKEFGVILDQLIQSQFTICRMRMIHLGRGSAENIVMTSHGADANFGKLVDSLTTSRSVIVEVMRSDAIGELQKLTEISIKDKVFVSSSLVAATAEINAAFDETYKSQRTAKFKNCTLALIRPHAVHLGLSGKIINAILEGGFDITDAEIFNLERVNAEEFLEVYKGVVPEYHLMLDQLTSGPLVALEVTGPTEQTVTTFREFVGPTDPSLAKQLRPKSLRAQFGIDKVKNAIHCTDLEDDGHLEVQFFFRIL